MTKYRSLFYFRLLVSAGLMVLLLLSGERVRESCFNALILCGRLIIPSLFPFLVLSSFLNSLGLPSYLGKLLGPLLGKVYNISAAGSSALLMGLLGGYPMGAAYIARMEQSGAIDASEGERLVAFCNNSGPAFIMGVMGLGVFGSARAGLKLYTVHILSALTCAFFFRRGVKSEKSTRLMLNETSTARALVEGVKQSVTSLLYICGFVISFSVLLELLDTGGFLSRLCLFLSQELNIELKAVRAAITGLLELGSAAGLMGKMEPSPTNMALAAGLLSWGGLSVHFQTLAVLSDSKIKGTLHPAGRLISAVAAVIWALILP